jgi:hypothetical protein
MVAEAQQVLQRLEAIDYGACRTPPRAHQPLCLT